MSLERSEGVLCLIGAGDLPGLEAEILRVQTFLERSRGLRLIDVVYTATRDARGKQCVVGLWVASLEEMARKLTMALNALRSGRTRLRDKSGIFFTTRPLALEGGKVAFIFPGTGSFHLEMMRDLALTFDGVRERFDDMEEAFAGFCDVASPSEWLFSTAPEHTLPLSASRDFLPLLASASTYLASKVFADFLRGIGVQPAAVGGVGLGAFSAFHATHHDPKLRLVQILRDAGKMLLRLGAEAATPWLQLTVSGFAVEQLRALEAASAGRLVVAQELTADDCVLAVAPDYLETVEATITAGGGLSVTEPLLAPFNTGTGGARMRQIFERFFAKYVTCEPQVTFYSSVTGQPMGHSTSSVVSALVDQMANPLHFRQMIEAMYASGCRLFVEVGARGLLSPLIAKILAGREEPIATIPMHILHRSGGVQVGQAAGLLAAHGVPIDYSGLRFFAHAQRLDFDAPLAEGEGESLTLRLTRELPAIRPELIDAHRILGMESALTEEATQATHAHALPANFPTTGLVGPLLRAAQELERSADRLELRCSLRLEDFPFLNDYAIGTAGISLSDPQMRGLTLFSVPTGLEVMAEAAQRLLLATPNARSATHVLCSITHLRAPRWLSFDFGQLDLRISVTRTREAAPEVEGQTALRVRLGSDASEGEVVHPVMEALFTFAPAVPEAPETTELQPLVAPKQVNWDAREIYPGRLFQGPLLRNVRHVSGWGYNGLDYELRIPSRSATVRASRNPLFTAMPLLLDAVVSGFPLWRSHERFHGAISLPFRCQAIRYYAVWVPEGTRLRCALRLVNVTPRSFQVDIQVTDTAGHPILAIEAWEEMSGRAGRALRDFVMNPAKFFITQPLPATLLPDPAAEVVGALYVNDAPDFFVSNQELWLKALAAAVLTHNERENFAQMGGTAHRRLEWLLGRTAAKESVRRLLLQNFNLYEPAADIAIWKDALGKPHPVGEWQSQVSAPLDLTIAHTAGLVLGASVLHGHIGLDVESVDRDLTEDFLRGVFTLEEQELATKSGDGPTAILRFWCAKEAISKALGTGIRFAPTDLRIRTSEAATGMLQMELLGAWADNFPHLRGKLIPIKTSILFGHAIACCLLA
ncbi:MAG: 4'-phosphopantetheinyl transferase superfamily protein [Candidatus Spyradenecus sp.]